jgi:hypothetical protein
MSKKITGNDLKRIIKEALQGQKLDEKIELPYDVPDDIDDFIPVSKPYTGVKSRSKSNRKFLAAIKALASEAEPPGLLDEKDLIAAMQRPKKTAAALKGELLDSGVPKEFLKELSPLLDAAEKKTKWYKGAKTKAKKLDVMSTFTQMDKGKVSTTTQLDKGYELGTFPSVYRGMHSDERDYKKIDPNKVKPDVMLFKVFQSIGGNTVVEKFTNLQVFAKSIMENDLDKWMEITLGVNSEKGATPEQEFKALNYAMVLTMLGDSSKTGDSSNAGYFFEGFLAYLISAPIVGKAGGAADNIAILSKEGRLKLSAKFYLNKAQTYQDEEGMLKDLEGSTKAGVNNLYYLTIEKNVTGESKNIRYDNKPFTATGAEFDTLSLYLTRYWTKEGVIYGVALDENGVAQEGTEDKLKIIKNADPEKSGNAMLFAGNLSKSLPILEFPVLPLDTVPKNFDEAKEYVATQTATKISEKIQESAQKKMASFVSIVQSLKDLEYKSKEYSGDKAARAFSKKGGPTASDAIRDIHDSYAGLYNQYKFLFSDVRDRTEFKESKKITANFLKKLISETLKK